MDPGEQLRWGSRAAARAVEHIVSPWWAYVLSGVVWSVAFAFSMGLNLFWLAPVVLAIGVVLIASLRAQVTGVRVSDRLQMKGLDIRAVAWLLGAFSLFLVLLVLGLVGRDLYGWDWAPWVAGAWTGPLWAVTEWRIDVSVRRTLRGG